MLFCASSQAIVLCFRLHFTKDNITNNTAAATVRQVVTVVFERMVAEDEKFKGEREFLWPVEMFELHLLLYPDPCCLLLYIYMFSIR